MKPFVYLATPYSHPDPEIRYERFLAVTRAAGRLMSERDLVVYSPITHNHPIKQCCDLPGTWEYWERVDKAFLSCAAALFVLTLDGWSESVGVKAEIGIAEELGIAVHYISPEEV